MRVSSRRLSFPAVNAISVGLLLALLGYYLSDLARWLVVGLAMGAVVGLLAEFGLEQIGGWIYRRRALLVVLLEIPLIIFIAAPYAYVAVIAQPINTPVCCATPADFGASYETVNIPAADGVTLAGWYIPPSSGSAPSGAVILLAHGAAGNRLGMMWYAERLARVGYGVLMYDQRALGESTGSYQTWGFADYRDVPYLVDWLSARAEVNPKRIGAVGSSLGAHILLFAAPDEPRIAALFLDGAAAGRVADFPMPQDAGEHFALLMNQLLENAMVFHAGIAPMPPPFHEQLPRIAPRHLLLVVAGQDDFELRSNQQYETLLGENAALWVIDNAHHVGGPGLIPDEYTARMTAFFEAALAGN